MQFWITNFILFFIYAVVFRYLKKDSLFLKVAFVHFGILAAARGLEVGTDTLYYAKGYWALVKYGHLLNHAMSSSQLFMEYMKIGANFIKSANGYMILTTIPFMYFCYIFIKNYAVNYYSSFFVFIFSYFYFGFLNTSRQYLAISITFISFHFFCKRKYLLSVIVFLIAVGCHSAVFPFFLFYFVALIKWNVRRIQLFAISLLSSLYILPVLFDVVIKVWPVYAWMKRALFSKKLTSGGRASFVYGMYCLIGFLLMLYYFLYSQKKLRIVGIECKNNEGNVENREKIQFWLMALTGMACVIYLLFPRVIIYSRVAMTFYAYNIVLLPNALAMIKEKTKLVKGLTLAPFIFFTCIQIYQGYAGVANYAFFK